MTALERANEVRFYRAELKKDIAAKRVNADDVLARRDPMLDTMLLHELLLAVPRFGEKRLQAVRRQTGTTRDTRIGNLTARQLGELLVVLREERTKVPGPSHKRKVAA